MPQQTHGPGKNFLRRKSADGANLSSNAPSPWDGWPKSYTNISIGKRILANRKASTSRVHAVVGHCKYISPQQSFSIWVVGALQSSLQQCAFPGRRKAIANREAPVRLTICVKVQCKRRASMGCLIKCQTIGKVFFFFVPLDGGALENPSTRNSIFQKGGGPMIISRTHTLFRLGGGQLRILKTRLRGFRSVVCHCRNSSQNAISSHWDNGPCECQKPMRFPQCMKGHSKY